MEAVAYEEVFIVYVLQYHNGTGSSSNLWILASLLNTETDSWETASMKFVKLSYTTAQN
jgi:hypothetical protein